jgi:hypothetical protein
MASHVSVPSSPPLFDDDDDDMMGLTSEQIANIKTIVGDSPPPVESIGAEYKRLALEKEQREVKQRVEVASKVRQARKRKRVTTSVRHLLKQPRLDPVLPGSYARQLCLKRKQAPKRKGYVKYVKMTCPFPGCDTEYSKATAVLIRHYRCKHFGTQPGDVKSESELVRIAKANIVRKMRAPSGTKRKRSDSRKRRYQCLWCHGMYAETTLRYRHWVKVHKCCCKQFPDDGPVDQPDIRNMFIKVKNVLKLLESYSAERDEPDEPFFTIDNLCQKFLDWNRSSQGRHPIGKKLEGRIQAGETLNTDELKRLEVSKAKQRYVRGVLTHVFGEDELDNILKKNFIKLKNFLGAEKRYESFLEKKGGGLKSPGYVACFMQAMEQLCEFLLVHWNLDRKEELEVVSAVVHRIKLNMKVAQASKEVVDRHLRPEEYIIPRAECVAFCRNIIIDDEIVHPLLIKLLEKRTTNWVEQYRTGSLLYDTSCVVVCWLAWLTAKRTGVYASLQIDAVDKAKAVENMYSFEEKDGKEGYYNIVAHPDDFWLKFKNVASTTFCVKEFMMNCLHRLMMLRRYVQKAKNEEPLFVTITGCPMQKPLTAMNHGWKKCGMTSHLTLNGIRHSLTTVASEIMDLNDFKSIAQAMDHSPAVAEKTYTHNKDQQAIQQRVLVDRIHEVNQWQVEERLICAEEALVTPVYEGEEGETQKRNQLPAELYVEPDKLDAIEFEAGEMEVTETRYDDEGKRLPPGKKRRVFSAAEDACMHSLFAQEVIDLGKLPTRSGMSGAKHYAMFKVEVAKHGEDSVWARMDDKFSNRQIPGWVRTKVRQLHARRDKREGITKDKRKTKGAKKTA